LQRVQRLKTDNYTFGGKERLEAQAFSFRFWAGKVFYSRSAREEDFGTQGYLCGANPFKVDKTVSIFRKIPKNGCYQRIWQMSYKLLLKVKN